MQNFIYPDNSYVHMQGVDGLVSHIKTNFRVKRGVPKKNFQKYLSCLSLQNLYKCKGEYLYYFYFNLIYYLHY